MLWPVLALFFVSGACGLIYEIGWMRMLRLVMGNTVFTSATVLAVFMAGLALGSGAAGRLAARCARPLRTYALLEGLVGLYGLLTPLLLAAATPVYAWLYHHLALSFLLLGLGRFLVSGALLLIPATLMGATLPLLSRFLVRRQHLGRELGRLYALNTLGAALGAAGTGFVLIPSLGVHTTLALAALGNLLICAASVWLARSREAPAPPRSEPLLSPRPGRGALVLWGMAGAGFASMVYEVSWTRALSMLIGSSVYAFSLMLAAFIAGLGLGSLVLASWIDRRRNLLLCLGILELAVGGCALLVVPLLGMLPLYIVELVDRYAASFALLHGLEFLGVFLLMLGPTFLMGAVFPAAAKACARTPGRVSRSVGSTYAANTLGALLGAAAGGFLLLPWLGVQGSLAAAVGLNLLLGLGFVLDSGWISTLRRAALATAPVFLLALIFWKMPTWDIALLNSAPYLYAGQYKSAARLGAGDLRRAIEKNRHLLYSREGMTATVTVWDLLGELFMRVNGKITASSRGKDLRSHSLLVHLPLLLHPRPEKVLLIGLGCGISLGALEQYPVKKITCLELSPEVVEAAALFAGVNYNALADPRLEMIVGDGRNHVALSRQRYDVIVSQPSTLWIAGMADLFTREFFAAGRRRLAPGGLMATWIQAYALEESDLKTIAKTFRSVFAHASMWELMPGIDYLLVGSDQPISLSYRRLAGRLADPRLRADFARNGTADAANLVCSFVMQDEQIDAFAGAAPLHTDDNALLEFSAPRGLYRDLGRRGGLFSLGSLQPYRQRDLAFLAEAPGEELQRAWSARRLALQALVYQRRGQSARALHYLERAAARRPRDMEVQRVLPQLSFALAEGLLRRGRYGAALELYDRLLRALPDQPVAYYRKGELLERLGRVEEAAAAYEKALQGAPGATPSAMRLGALYLRHNQLGRAAAAYRAGLEANPGGAELLNNLGTVYLMQKRFDEGVAAFKRALEVKPEDARTWGNLGTAYLRRRDFAAAAPWLEGAVARRPGDAELHRKLAAAYRGMGATDKARRQLGKALEAAPGDPRLQRLLQRLEAVPQ